MKLENLKEEFPRMPEEIRDLIEQEVERQVKTERPRFKSRKTWGRTLTASLVAVVLCGTTVFAGVGIYRMQQKKIGEHGISVHITGDETAEGSAAEKKLSIPDVKLETGYLPEGMVRVEPGKYCFENALYQGGISMVFYRMDTGDDTFEMQHGDVLASETFFADGNQGVYLEYPDLYEDDITFNRRIYVAFTDVHYVMEMYVASDVSKEEAIRIAEQIRLVPVADTEDEEIIVAQDWSSRQEPSEKEAYAEEEGYETITSVAVEEMKNTHAIGDSFALDDRGLTARVAGVQIADDLALLDATLWEEDFAKETDENGALRPAKIQYVKAGDRNTLSEEVESREVPQKLVYAAVEYTNTSGEEMTDVLFFGSLACIAEADGRMQMITEEQPGENDTWEMAVNHGLSARKEMIYYDVHGGERGNNYIKSIKPGETVTVHMAWIVTEEELENLYLNLDTYGGIYEFTENSLQTGYVDIRSGH